MKPITLSEFLKQRRGESELKDVKLGYHEYILFSYGKLISRKGNEFNTRPHDILQLYDEASGCKVLVIRKAKGYNKSKRIIINTDKSFEEIKDWASLNGRFRGVKEK